MTELLRLREQISADKQSEIKRILQDHGDQFLTQKSRKPGATKKEYSKNWMGGQSLADVAFKVGGEQLYRKLYRNFADWHHWNIEGFNGVLEFAPGSLRFLAPQPENAATVLAVAFQCIIQTAVLADSHLTLGFEKQLSELRDSYVASLGKLKSES